MFIGQFLDFKLLLDIFYIASSFVLSIVTVVYFTVKLVVVEEIEVTEVDESHPDDSCCVKKKKP